MFDYMTTEEVVEMAHRVGRYTANESSGLVDADDAAAEVLANVTEWADQLKDKGPGYLYTAMRRSAGKYAARLRYERMADTATYLYTPREVRALLAEAFFDPNAWDAPSAKDDYLSASITKGTVVVSLLDLKTAFLELTAKQREQLWRRFAEGQDAEGSPAVAVSRAIAALTRRMNTAANKTHQYHDGPGSPDRLNPTSAAAQAWAADDSRRPEGPPDPLVRLQGLRSREANQAPGTYFDWDKDAA